MNRKIGVVVLLTVFAVTLAFAGIATATTLASRTLLVRSSLVVGNLVPKPKDASRASAVLTGKVTSHAKRGSFTWTLRFTNLSSKARSAHITLAKTGVMVIPLCAPCTAGAHGEYFGPLGRRSRLLKAMLHGSMFVTIETKKNPKGEVRGQLKVTSA